MTARFATTLAALAALAASGSAFAAEPPIRITSPWVRATPKGAQVVGGYATITNTGTTPDRLVGASLASARTGEIHSMSMSGGVMHMARLPDGLTIAPGATVTLAPGGNHLMFPQPTAPLTAGQNVAGSLTFEKAGTIAITFQVAGMGSKSAPDAHAMPGMRMH